MNSTQSNADDRSSRRTFLAATGGLALDFMIVPAPRAGGGGIHRTERAVDVGGIGAGGMGGGDIATVARLGANIVALCDVDDQRAAGSFHAFPKARRYKDFREMIDKEHKHHRRCHGRHARPYSRRRVDGGHPGRQACLLPEAPDSHALRMPRADQGRARRRASPPRWEIRGMPPKGRASPTNGFRPA